MKTTYIEGITTTAICTKCKEEKTFENFDKCKRMKNGCRSHCKKCRQEERQEKEYKEKHAQFNKKYYHAGFKDYHKEFYEENKEYIKNRMFEYKLKPNVMQRRKDRFKNDEKYRTKVLMRSALYRCLKGKAKEGRTAKLLGYTAIEFLDRFRTDIKTYNDSDIDYHIDHKIPIEWFIDSAPVNIISALDNMQIISATENLHKRHFYADPVSADFALKVIKYIQEQYKDQITII